ncbi:MAG: tetratricopeptide repeat protein [Candidatus Midichloria sp.]|nr:tetratricopeptide repeat protein [Candidatus Midichloria sp.]
MVLHYKLDDMESYHNKGIALEKLGKHKEAIQNFDLAIKYKPDLAENYLAKGIALLSLEKNKEAKDNFNLALKYRPNLIEEYEKIIKGLRKLGNSNMADYLEEKLQILKNNL